MANPEHVAILKQGVEAWNRWRKETARSVDWNMAGYEMALPEMDMADLSGAHLAGADLNGASLNGANLTKADLTGADMWGAVLGGTKLNGANLHHASLNEAYLSGTELHDADFTDLQMGYTSFANLDLSKVRGLETVRHTGPSSIGIDTIYKSKGNIPDVFLRGCGVPDDMIAYIRSIAGAVQFYSCFISYSTKDQEFADRLYADLQAKGVRCWFAPHDIRGGRKIHEQIDEAIRLHDKLLLILSEHSMSSDWVQEELARARRREVKEGQRMLFPVRLVAFEALEAWECFDADSKKDSAREIREYFILDFSNWKDHDSYQKAFTRLVADLKAESR